MGDGAVRSTDFVEALAKGMAILEALGRSAPEMTLSEVARLVGLSPAAARRSLLTLEALGYVGRQAKRFHLKPKIMTLGSSFYLAARIDEILLPDLRTLVDTFGDASSIGTLDGTSVVYLAHHSVQRARRAMAVAGARYPAFATSMGRVLLAALPEDAREAYLDTFDPVALTSKTLTDRDCLRQEILRVAADGYSTTVDQLDYGITALAVPIRDGEGRTIAALNSSGYTGLVTPEAMVRERLPALRESAMHVSHQIARHPMLRAVLCAP
ncbi:IclR family transcriptional regulator domain-containing protein [Acuticoccus kandeliae]|uniref:IclR family transcriptional regulator domain-containing protein n=1 Tax=Acuticoccus kandeliae TaxID=2073160 RepID=UPI000D3EAA25|nr:IclR family transcriptional regulator C-terminal domain-containing protein [Acuticoccus kandeliae]